MNLLAELKVIIVTKKQWYISLALRDLKVVTHFKCQF